MIRNIVSSPDRSFNHYLEHAGMKNLNERQDCDLHATIDAMGYVDGIAGCYKKISEFLMNRVRALKSQEAFLSMRGRAIHASVI